MSDLEQFYGQQVYINFIDLKKVARIDDLIRRGWIDEDFILLANLPVIYIQYLKLVTAYPFSNREEDLYSTMHVYDLEHIIEIEMANPELQTRVFYRKLCK